MSFDEHAGHVVVGNAVNDVCVSVRQLDVVRRVDDAKLVQAAREARVYGAGSLLQQSGVYLVVARKRRSGLGGYAEECLVGSLVSQSAQLVGARSHDALVVKLLRWSEAPVVDCPRRIVVKQAVEVVAVHLLEFGVAPNGSRRGELA